MTRDRPEGDRRRDGDAGPDWDNVREVAVDVGDASRSAADGAPRGSSVRQDSCGRRTAGELLARLHTAPAVTEPVVVDEATADPVRALVACLRAILARLDDRGTAGRVGVRPTTSMRSGSWQRPGRELSGAAGRTACHTIRLVAAVSIDSTRRPPGGRG